MTPSAFLAAVGPGASAANKQTGIPASVSLSQAILESAWGSSGLAQNAKNLFGIKASDDWVGPTIELPTREWANGEFVTVLAEWRAYPSWQASILDHTRFFFVNERYAPALRVRNDAAAFAQQIQLCGYATDPLYATKLLEIIHDRNLLTYDVAPASWSLLSWADVNLPD
jgi:flagellar protein FlgJ